MSITKKDVAAIANLARLELPDETLEQYATQLGSVLGYMEQLGELDTSGIEPLYSPVEHPAPLRVDEAVSTISREEILRNAPQTDGQFFIVPRIV